MSILPETYTAPEEYLVLEREAETKSEYADGQIYAMAGASLEHSAIALNLAIAIGIQLRGKPCRAFTNDLRIATSPGGLYAYPDLSVMCGEPAFLGDRRDVVANPTLIAEVLSPSTEAYDRGRKFGYYRQIESLADYLLVSQDSPAIDHFHKSPSGKWDFESADGLDSSIHLPSIEVTLRLSEVYDKVVFPPEPDTTGEAPPDRPR